MRIFGEVMSYSRSIEGRQDARRVAELLARVGFALRRDGDGVARILPAADIKRSRSLTAPGLVAGREPLPTKAVGV